MSVLSSRATCEPVARSVVWRNGRSRRMFKTRSICLNPGTMLRRMTRARSAGGASEFVGSGQRVGTGRFRAGPVATLQIARSAGVKSKHAALGITMSALPKKQDIIRPLVMSASANNGSRRSPCMQHHQTWNFFGPGRHSHWRRATPYNRKLGRCLGRPSLPGWQGLVTGHADRQTGIVEARDPLLWLLLYMPAACSSRP